MEPRSPLGNACAEVLKADGIVAVRDMLPLPCCLNLGLTAAPQLSTKGT